MVGVLDPRTRAGNGAQTWKSLQDQMLVKVPGDINGIDFMIKDLENCTVMLLDHTAQIQVDRCKNTKFFIGPVKASLFIRNCDSCEVTVCCSQYKVFLKEIATKRAQERFDETKKLAWAQHTLGTQPS